MSKNDGGPAFGGKVLVASVNVYGRKTGGSEYVDHPGMTLRDYFAAKALPIAAKVFEEGHPNGWEGIAIAAYSIADAMLVARAKGE